MTGFQILVVDDERNMRETVRRILKDEGYEPLTAASGEEAIKMLMQNDEVSLLLLDARMPGMDGFELLEKARARYPNVPVVMMTAYATPKLAVRAIKGGAVDYLPKPFEPEELLLTISNALSHQQLLAENKALKGLLARRYQVNDIVGVSPDMQRLRQLILTVAPTPSTIFILGESGTGKELVAGALHYHSPRRESPFVSVNCAAIPDTLLESELFGHEKGAFTGATSTKRGRFEEADTGTMFLDEIGDMSPSLQSKLLRVIEDKTFSRVGSTETKSVDVRIIAATNRDIDAHVREGKFREDLYHRLNVVRIEISPLRQRREDIEMLARHFLVIYNAGLNKNIRGFTPAALEVMQRYDWPGNVRELRNAIERAVILGRGENIEADALPAALHDKNGAPRAAVPVADLSKPMDQALADYERQIITDALSLCRYNLGQTADKLGVSRHALRYRMQKLGLKVDEEQ
jgi:DNA-binding NtrC family response regulator